MNPRLKSIIGKLYITLYWIIIMFIVFIGFRDVKDQYVHTNIFDKVHSSLEKEYKYNALRSGYDLKQSRRLLAEESKDRWKNNRGASPKDQLANEFLIDTSCFDEDGNKDSEIPKHVDTCKPMYEFYPLYPLESALEYIGAIIGVTLAMFFIRNWAKWLVK